MARPRLVERDARVLRAAGRHAARGRRPRPRRRFRGAASFVPAQRGGWRGEMSQRPAQWRAILENQWKWTKGLALFGVLVGFALPLLSLRTALGAENVATFINIMAAWGVGYAIAAGALGLMLGVVAW